MGELVLTTYDWVPPPPRGHVRDIRVRWALEEAGLPYRVESTSFKDRGDNHIANQPFAQIPWLKDGDISIFESGAILLHLGELSDKLMPTDPKGRAEVQEWVFAALNSMEMVSVCWTVFMFSGFDKNDSAEWKAIDGFMGLRLSRLEPVLANREWLAGRFSIADILMADVLRILARFERLGDNPACRAYIERATARPAFKKAYEDQMAHFAAADSDNR
jgi:glutathione S-transferase